jgi:hypothetical protein
MVRHSRDAAEQILDAAPREPCGFRDPEMFLYGRIVRAVNGGGPLGGVGVWTTPEPGKEIELKVIVNVDQSREKQVTREVIPPPDFDLAVERKDAGPANCQVEEFAMPRR